MDSLGVPEEGNDLSGLIDRALNGETVVITRKGKPVVELKAVAREPGPITPEGLEWIRARRIRPENPDMNPINIVERMREEYEARLS